MSLKETSCQRCQKSSFDAACCIGVNVLMRTLFEPCVRHILESPALPNSNRVWRRVYRMYTSLNIHGSFVNHVAAAPYDSLMAIFWGIVFARKCDWHTLCITPTHQPSITMKPVKNGRWGSSKLSACHKDTSRNGRHRNEHFEGTEERRKRFCGLCGTGSDRHDSCAGHDRGTD